MNNIKENDEIFTNIEPQISYYSSTFNRGVTAIFKKREKKNNYKKINELYIPFSPKNNFSLCNTVMIPFIINENLLENENNITTTNTNFNKTFSISKDKDTNHISQTRNMTENDINETLNDKSKINKENTKVNENKNINNQGNEDNNFEAESNVNLNNKLPFNFPLKPKRFSLTNRKHFFSNENNNNNINSSSDQNLSMNLNSDKNRSQEIDKSNLYSDKRIDDNVETTAKTKISNLKLVLSFIRYFKAIDLNKSLFMKDIFFKEIFKKEINEEFLENNLNYIINGEFCSLNFIKNVEFNSD